MHVMIDLETLSLRPDAAIIELAAVEFEPVRGGNIHVDRALNLSVAWCGQKRHIDPDTLDFWCERTIRGNEVFINSCSNKALSLRPALVQLVEWWRSASPVQAVWSHGAAFDIPILTHAFMQERYDTPWSHRLVRDTRTLYYTSGMDNHPKLDGHELQRLANLLGHVGRQHHALDDAVAQCLELQKAI